ncbi:YpoC family protein [Bacillus sp. REN16]|uniref:YpoC family protein n=1 Tax=Bacillus sp. REN16 TaxID=2887296 RepID=UPI001E39A043|nr:hypothetical protein [Bacillus sp. REN16]MCC3358362.1 hypothetical protein [Bacillus sp. REN16]
MDNEKIISDIREKWDARKNYLGSLFQNRDKAAIVEPMDEAIEEFLTFLFLINEKRIPIPDRKMLQDSLLDLVHKPINLDERLSFVLKKPNQYHAFIQLNELYIELLKLNAKLKIREYKNNAQS